MSVTNEEEARRLYLGAIYNNSRYHEDISPREIEEYRAHSSGKLEVKWVREACEEYLRQIERGNPGNKSLFHQALWYYNNSIPIKLVLEKLEILISEGCIPEDQLKKVLIRATDTFINRSDESEEQALLRIMELAEPYANEWEREYMRFMIIGPCSKDEAKRCYRKLHFNNGSSDFKTNVAISRYQQFISPENMLRWKQEYFDEWTGKGYFLNKADLEWVNLIELVSQDYGIYSRENMEKLYNKLADYKNCIDVDEYGGIVFDIKGKVFERLYTEGEYELLERFIKLAEKIYKNVSDTRYKDYFLKDFPKKAEKYRTLLKEARSDKKD